MYCILKKKRKTYTMRIILHVVLHNLNPPVSFLFRQKFCFCVVAHAHWICFLRMNGDCHSLATDDSKKIGVCRGREEKKCKNK